MKNSIIGLDLDNTIINYENAFLIAAQSRGLLPQDVKGGKNFVRDSLRIKDRDLGEMEWQKLQGYVYGQGLGTACLFDGFLDFLKRSLREKCKLYIVSHKTEYGHFDPLRINIREAALSFLKDNGVMAWIPTDHIFFCSSLKDKILKISELQCEVFIDDLDKVFMDPNFPQSTKKLLFKPKSEDQSDIVSTIEYCHDWASIEGSLFDERGY